MTLANSQRPNRGYKEQAQGIKKKTGVFRALRVKPRSIASVVCFLNALILKRKALN